MSNFPEVIDLMNENARLRSIAAERMALFKQAAAEVERLRGALEEIATFTSDPVAEHAAREALSPADGNTP